MNIETLLLFLGESLAKSIAILLAATALVRLWRGSTAAQRHLVWLAAIVAVLLLPTMRLVTPRWTVPLERPTPVRVSIEPPPIEQRTESLAPEQPLNLAAPKAVAPAWKIPNWRTLALGAWLGGAALLLTYRLLGNWRLGRIERASIPLDDVRIEGLAHGALGDLGITRGVKIRVSKECRVPMTWGSLRPVLLLPVESRQWTDVQLLAALRHEAGHISRWDYPARWLAHLACALYWPNPLMWRAVRSLRVAQEQATDDLVLRAGTKPEEYASQLFEAARLVAVRGLFARHAVAMASPSTLEDRVLAIVDPRRDRRPLSLRALVGGILAVVLTLGLATAAQLAAQEKAAPATNEADAPQGPQITIEAKFVEITGWETWADEGGQWLTDILTDGKGERIKSTRPTVPAEIASLPHLAGLLTPEQYSTVLRALSQKKGVDLMSAPRVTTRSGQRAVIEIAREFKFPTDWEKQEKAPSSEIPTSVELEKGGQKWAPKAFETRKVGVILEVQPVTAGGTIDLQVTPTVTEFTGFIDLDGDRKFPADMQETAKLLENLDAPLPAVPPGHRAQPIFSERKLTTSVTVFPGQTIILGQTGKAPENDKAPSKRLRRMLLVFVTSEVVKENASTTGAPPTMPVTAGNVLHDPKTGVMKYTGDVKIETAEATIRTKEAEIQPKKTAPAESPAMTKARKIILPRVEFREATVPEALEFLQREARELDEERQGAHLDLRDPAKATARITLSLTEVPLSEVLNYVANLANLKMADEGGSFIFTPMPLAAGSTPPAPKAEPKTAPASGPAYDKASRIIIPKIELRDATVNEAVHFLNRKAAEIGEGLPGINVVLKPKPGAESRISLSLTNVPLTDVLRYIAELAGLEMKAEPQALVLQPSDAAGLVTKAWRVSAEILRRVAGTDESTAAVKAALIHRKVAFPEGSSLAWLPDSERLVARNTQANLQRIDELIEKAIGQ